MDAYKCQGQGCFLPARGGPRISMLVTNSKSYLTQEGNDFFFFFGYSMVKCLPVAFRPGISGLGSGGSLGSIWC